MLIWYTPAWKRWESKTFSLKTDPNILTINSKIFTVATSSIAQKKIFCSFVFHFCNFEFSYLKFYGFSRFSFENTKKYDHKQQLRTIMDFFYLFKAGIFHNVRWQLWYKPALFVIELNWCFENSTPTDVIQHLTIQVQHLSSTPLS